MDSRQSSKRPQPPNRIKFLTGFVFLAMFWGTPPGVRAGVPDWFRAAARAELPKYPEDTNAVILLDEHLTTVSDDGEIKTVYRRAIKILRPQGREMGTVAVYFDSETRLTYLKAWSITAQGVEYELKEKDAIESSLGSESLYEDTRRKGMRIPAADPGSVVGYEFEQRRRPSILQDNWLLQSDLPIRHARVGLRLPQGWEFRTFWINRPPQDAQPGEKDQVVWRFENIPAIESEPSMPEWQSLAARMGVTYYDKRGDAAGRSIDSWQDVGAWYARLAEGRRNVTPQMHQKAVELTAGATTTLDKIRALASFVQKEIRYVAIEIGIGGYQPHSAGDIFTNRYGDCKDKVTLLSALLGEIGVKSDYVLINVNRGVTSPEFPTALEFDHVILAIRLPGGEDTQLLYSVVEDPKLGTQLFFDPTDSLTPLGYLPTALQASYGLRVVDGGGELVKLPLLPPNLNRLLRTAKLTLTSTGAISGNVDEIRWGYPAVELRGRLLSLPERDRKKYIENFLGNSMDGIVLAGSQVDNLDKPGESLVLHYTFEARDYGKAAGDLLLVRPRVMGTKSDDVLEETQGKGAKERKQPIEFPAASLQSDIFEIALPTGYQVDELPPPVSLDAGAATYRSKVEMEGNVMRYTRHYQINDVLVPTNHLGDLKKFYRQVTADESNSAVLKQIAH